MVIHQKILTSSFISIILSYAMIAGIDVGSCTEGGPNHLYIQGGNVINHKCTLFQVIHQIILVLGSS